MLERVTEGMEPYSVAAVEQACREKFPEPRTKGKDLLDFELRALKGRAGPETASGVFSGSLYNGNEAIAVTKVQIDVTTTAGKKRTTHTYRHAVEIPPQAARDFSFKILPGEPEAIYSWAIIGATGIVIDEAQRQKNIKVNEHYSKMIRDLERETEEAEERAP